MSININNVTYKLQTASTTKDFLKGGVGEWGLFSCDFDAYPYFQPNRGASLTAVSPNIIRLDSGDVWNDYAFSEGDQMFLRYNLSIKQPSSDSATFPVTFRFDIEFIDENLIYATNIVAYNLNGTLRNADSFTDFAIGQILVPGLLPDSFDMTIPSTQSFSGVTITTSDAIIYVRDTNFSAYDNFEIQYGKIENENRNSTQVISAIDGTTPTLIFERMNFSSTTQLGSIKSTKSGSGVLKSKLTKVFDPGYTIKVGIYDIPAIKYELDILFNIALFGEQFDLENGSDPTYFFNDNTITDGLVIKAFRFADDDTIGDTKQKILKKGRVGYLDEKFTTIPSSVTVSNVTYFDKDNLEDTSLAYNETSTIEFLLNGVSNNSRFNFGISIIPNSYQTNKKTTIENYQLATGATGFEGITQFDDWRNTSFEYFTTNQVSNLYVEGYGSLDINHISTTQINSTTVKVRIRFVPNAESNLVLTDNFCVYANVDNTFTVKSDYQQFKEYITIVGELRKFESRFFPHYLDLDTDTGISSPDVTTVQDGYIVGKFNLNRTDISRVFFRVEAVNGDIEYTLAEENFEVSENQDVDTLNLFRTSTISGLPEGRDLIKFSRDATYDETLGIIFNRGYSFKFPFVSRWEYWINRIDTPDLWFDATQPQEGRNNDWIHYASVSGTTIKFALYVETSDGFRVSRYDITPRDYNTSPEVTTAIRVYRKSDDQLLYESTNSEGYDEGYVIEDQDMYIIATHTKTTPWDTDATGFIKIQRLEQNGQYEIQSTFEGIQQPLNSVLSDITKTVNGNDLELRCDLVGSYINSLFNYQIDSRSFTNFNPDNPIGGLAGGQDNFGDNFAPNFASNNIGTFVNIP